MTLTEFLLARIAEDEEVASHQDGGLMVGAHFSEARVLAECEAKTAIVEWHKSWPVLVESPPKFESDTGDVTRMTMRMSQQIAWTTEQAYRDQFGSEPPTGPVLRFLALPYADHPDYNPDWRP